MSVCRFCRRCAWVHIFLPMTREKSSGRRRRDARTSDGDATAGASFLAAVVSQARAMEGGGELERALAAHLDCPVCYAHIGPRVYQCPAGHLVCFACARSLAHCPTCRRAMPSLGVRCLVMEQLAALLPPRPCDHAGCSALVGWSNSQSHAEECEHQPAACPRCRWTGTIGELAGHMDAHHGDEDLARGRPTAGGALLIDVALSNPRGLRYDFGWCGLVKSARGRWYTLQARTAASRGLARAQGAFLCFFCRAMDTPAQCGALSARVTVRGPRGGERHSVRCPCWSVCQAEELVAASRSVLRVEMDHALRMGGAAGRLYEEDMLDLAADPAGLSLRCRFEIEEGGGDGTDDDGGHGADDGGDGADDGGDGAGDGGDGADGAHQVGVIAAEVTAFEQTRGTTMATTANDMMAAMREG